MKIPLSYNIRNLFARRATTLMTALGIALTVAVLLSYMYYAGISDMNEGRGRCVGLLLAGLSLTAAWFAPRTVPLFAAAYLPFSVVFSYKSASMTVLNMANFLLCVMFVAWLRSRGGPGLRSTLLDKALVAFMVLALLSHASAWFRFGDQSLFQFVVVYRRWASPFLLYLMIRTIIRDRRDVRAIFGVVLGVTVLIGMLTWRNGITHQRRSVDKSRIGGVMDQPNMMGAFLAYHGILLLAVGLRGKRPFRLAAMSGFLVVTRSMLYTFSRGANLASLVGIVVTLTARGPLYLVAGVGGTWVVLAQFPQLVPDSAINRMKSTTAEGRGEDDSAADGSVDELDASARNRLYMWEAGIEMVRDRPILGVGLARFGRLSHEYLFAAGLDPEELRLRITAPHNAYVEIASEIGLPALVCAVVVLASLGWIALQCYARSSDWWERCLGLGVFGMVFGVATCSLFGSRMIDEALMSDFWMLAAAVSRASLEPRRQRLERRGAADGP